MGKTANGSETYFFAAFVFVAEGFVVLDVLAFARLAFGG